MVSEVSVHSQLLPFLFWIGEGHGAHFMTEGKEGKTDRQRKEGGRGEEKNRNKIYPSRACTQ
jgi:hypothetical protein